MSHQRVITSLHLQHPTLPAPQHRSGRSAHAAMAEENKQQQEGDAPDFAKKHQLEHKWTLWFDNPSTRQTLNRYGQGLRPVYSFDTVEDFWWCVPACSAFGLSCVGASGLSRHACVPFRAAGAPATLAAASVSCSRDCNIQAAGGRLRGHGAYVANSACSPTAADHPSLLACCYCCPAAAHQQIACTSRLRLRFRDLAV